MLINYQMNSVRIFPTVFRSPTWRCSTLVLPRALNHQQLRCYTVMAQQRQTYPTLLLDTPVKPLPPRKTRSEERRDGTECVRPCRSRWSPNHTKKKLNTVHSQVTP